MANVFMVTGPPPAPLMAIATAFYEDPTALGDSAGEEMDTDHFNELDKIFDLPYNSEQDPFSPAATSSQGGGQGGQGGHTHTQPQHSHNDHDQQQHTHTHHQHEEGSVELLSHGQAHSQQQQHHHHHQHQHLQHTQFHSTHGGDWHVKEEDASYHTAVDASCHIDASYHHVDASSHSMVESVLDASGHDSLIDSSGHYDDYMPSAGGKGDHRYMEHSCEACKRSKKRCNRRNPCQICTSRGIKCVPQVRGPGRPPGSKSNRTSSSISLASTGSRGSSSRGDIRSAITGAGISSGSAGTSSASSSNPSSLTRSISGHGLMQQEQEGNGVGGGSMSSSLPPRDPWHCRFFFEAARHCKEAFLKAWHENELDTAKCILLCNSWTKAATRFAPGVDMTFGICEQLQEVVGPLPGGSSSSGVAANSPATRSKSHAAQQAQMLSHPGTKEGMGTWCLPEELRKLDDGVSMLCGFMHMNDEFFAYTDERFSETFMSREEVINKVESFAVLPMLLLAEIFHPDDLPDVYAAVGSYWFRRRSPGMSEIDKRTVTPEASWICKCVDKRNREFLAMVRFRSFVAPTEGCPGAALLAIRPLQSSKYLCDPDEARSGGMGGRSLASTRLHLRDTLGALPTALAEHEEEGLELEMEEEEEDGDAMFRPLRRGMTVLSGESSGPQAVPGKSPLHHAHHHHHQESYTHTHTHGYNNGGGNGGAPHQGGMSWSGHGLNERMGGVASASQYHKTNSLGGSHHGMDQDASGSSNHSNSGTSSLPTAQLTQAQLFLLQDGSSKSLHSQPSEPLNAAQLLPQLSKSLYQQHHQHNHQLHHRTHTRTHTHTHTHDQDHDQDHEHEHDRPHPNQQHPQLRHHVSPDGLAVGEEDSGSVATDFELYGSSPSPEPALLSHSRSSPALRRVHSSSSSHQLSSSLAASSSSVAVPQMVRAVSSSGALGGLLGGGGGGISHATNGISTVREEEKDQGMRGDMSHSSSNTDLDMSCHGPQDPNGYGGLQWTPAPLSSMLGGDGVLVEQPSTTSQPQAPPRGSQSPAKQKRRMSRVGSANARSSPTNDGGGGVPPPEAEAGCLARSL